MPGLRADVVGRLQLADKVIDHERVHGLGPDPVEVAVVYAVSDDLIQAAWFYGTD